MAVTPRGVDLPIDCALEPSRKALSRILSEGLLRGGWAAVRVRGVGRPGRITRAPRAFVYYLS
jgi:hypothetical protein